MSDEFELISRIRGGDSSEILRGDITNLPPGYVEGFEVTIDTDYHVTIGAGSTSVEGRQVTVNNSHQIVDSDFTGTRVGPYFYYVYLDSSGEYKADRITPEYSDKYLYYAHPIFNWRAMAKLWVDDADNEIKYASQDVIGVSTTVTVAAYDADEIVEADYKCDNNGADQIFINMAIDFIAGAYGKGEIRLLRGTFTYDASIVYKAKTWLHGEGRNATVLDRNISGSDRAIEIIGTLGSEIEECRLSDLSITSSDNNRLATGLYATYADNLIIENVFVDGSDFVHPTSTAFNIENCVNLRIVRCRFDSCPSGDMYVGDCTRFLVEGCESTNGRYFLDTDGSSGIASRNTIDGASSLVFDIESLSSFAVVDNIVSDCGEGPVIQITDSQVGIVSGNTIKDTGDYYAVTIDASGAGGTSPCSEIVIEENILDTNSGVGNYGGIVIINNDDNSYITIRNNIVKDFTGWGIEVRGLGHQIGGNNVQGCTQGGIRIAPAGTATNTIVQGNYCTDNGADSGIDNANSDNFSDSGTNTQIHANSWQDDGTFYTLYDSLRIYKNDTDTTNGMLRLEQDGTGDAFMHFSLTGGAAYALGIDNSDSDKLKIGYHANTESGVATGTLLTLTTGGNLGIGDTTPAQKLDVNGSIQIADAAWVRSNGEIMIGRTAATNTLRIGGGDASDLLSFFAGGAEKATLLANGNTGFGTTTPDELLEIESSAATTALQISNAAADGDPYLAWALSGVKTFCMGVDDGDGDKLKIGTTAIDTNTRLTIDATGNIGMGIGSPDVRTHIEVGSQIGAVYGDPATAIKITGTADASSNYGGIQWDFAGTTGATNFGIYGVTNAGADSLRIVYNETTPVITVLDSLRVGIGIVVPDGKLHVYEGSAGAVTPNVSYDDLIVEVDTTGGLSILTPDASNAGIAFGSSSDNVGALLSWSYDNSLFTLGSHKAGATLRINSGAGAQGLRIDSNGNTMIGDQVTVSAQCHIDQSLTTAAEPVLMLDQADVSEEFIRFKGTAAAGVLTQSIVDDGDVTTATLQGWVKVYVEDDGNQITDQVYYMPLYTLV